MNPTDPIDVIRTTRLLKSKTSTGIDNISSEIIQDTISEIAEPLAHFFIYYLALAWCLLK